MSKRQAALVFIISLILIVGAFSFQQNLSQFRSAGYLGIFLINFFGSATLFLPAPAIASVVVGGVLYPPLFVAFVAALGAALGDMIGFVLGHSGRKIFLKDHKKWYFISKDLFKKFGSIVILVFAFIPNPFFDGIGILAGALSFSSTRFFVLLFVGRLMRNVLLAFLGSAFSVH